ncbi:MAG TPA: SDR family oxidoreductase [Blastocatellia bacterium]|nr:SDR family oxidoreductase [Blastocatellia bacterium]
MDSAQNFFLTGCASGIGQHLADRLLANGHKVWATDVNLPALTRHAELQHWPEERVRVRQLDVRNAEAWDAAVNEAVSELGSIDVLMNIAGYLWADKFYEMPAEEVDLNIDVNAKGVIFGTQAAARQMIKQGHGHIINISSMAGLVPIQSLAIYSASKYAVRGFSLAAAQELRPHGIFVTVVCPDAVETPMTARQRERAEAAILFSSPKLLTVEAVGDAIIRRVLTHRPLELYLPIHRGLLARLTDLFPSLAFPLGPLFAKRGRSHQLHMRKDAKAS